VLPLDALQRWMQAVVVHPGDIEAALAGPASAELPASRVGDVIRPTDALAPGERVAIYHGMYLLRMEEALASDYGALKHFLGDAAFARLVRDYVQVFPSRSHSLNRLGDHMVEFVANAPDLARRGFCHDLARLENAIAQVFDAEEEPSLDEAAIAAVPPEAWEHARLEPVAAFRLLAFRYPVNAYLQTVRDDDHDHPKARLRDEWVAVYRRDFQMTRLPLRRDGHALLSDLVGGVPLGAALEAAMKRNRRLSAETLSGWFRAWVAGGMFARIRR
jgi:hypothetical protein